MRRGGVASVTFSLSKGSQTIGKIYFISDAHLGYEGEEKEKLKVKLLTSFFSEVQREAETLYILGDLFDFWFEYKSVVPRGYTEVLFGIHQLILTGVRVVYIGGNHDFWVGSYLSDEIGMEVSREPLEAEYQGLRVYMAHGDGVSAGDRGYRALKRVLRNPISIKLFSLVHPDIGRKIARFASRSSRARISRVDIDYKDNLKIQKAYVNVAETKFEEGFDLVIFGHIHSPFVRRSDGKTLAVLGDWIDNFSYGVLSGGEFRIRRWLEDMELIQ